MNPFKILGVADNSAEDVCKRAYRRLCAKYHPDSLTGDREKFDEVQKAWGMLHGKQVDVIVQPSKKVYISFQDLFTFSFVYV